MNINRDALKRRALLSVWIGELWNILEMAVALWSGFRAGSVALLAYGFDAVIELFAGGVLIWRLSKEWKGREEEESAEHKAHRLVGITFFLLSAYILVNSVAVLVGWLPEPEKSLVGIALVIASAVVMSLLFWWKTGLAKRLGSRALRAEALQSLFCDLQDLTLIIGLGLNALWGWWWADPIAALALIPFILKEGWEGVSKNKE